MYNHDRKNAFASTYSGQRDKWQTKRESTYKKVCTYFNRLAVEEEAIGRDVCEMDLEDLQAAFNQISGTLHKTSMDVYTLLKTYISWCKERGYYTKDAINEIQLDDVDKFKRRMVSSRDSLRILLDQVFPRPARNQLNYIYRSFLWLSFMGYDDFEAVQIRTTDINFDTNKIVPSSRSLPVCSMYEEAFDDLWHACKLNIFDDYSRNKKVPGLIPREEGDLVLRWIVSRGEERKTKELINLFRPLVNKEFSNYRKRCAENNIDTTGLSIEASPHRIYMSGVFMRAAELEQEGIDPDIKSWYRNDYERWKAAFR